ncbi:MAG: hypothetical protein ABIR91_04020 [Candidatus Saccharimonadales bacterium]
MPAAYQTREDIRGSTGLLYDELAKQQANPLILEKGSGLIEYTDKRGVKRLLFTTAGDKSSIVGRVLAESKNRTALLAKHLAIPIPTSIVCATIQDARLFLEQHRRIVIKPLRGTGGRGVSTDIKSEKILDKAYAYAESSGRGVVAQQHINGADVRLLTIGGVFTSAVMREPAHVIGDGTSTILELIHIANTTPPRNDPALMSIMAISLSAAEQLLDTSITQIPAEGEKVYVAGPANVSLGGSLHEATHLVTPAMIADAEKISQRAGLGICGVDMMWDRAADKHYLIEVNDTPGIDIHNDPFSGTKSDCVQQYVQWLIA